MRLLVSSVLVIGSLVSSIKAEEESTTELIEKGDTLDQSLKTSQALAYYREAEKKDPDNAKLLVKISKELCDSIMDSHSAEGQKKLAEEALSYAKRAVKADPDNDRAHLSLALCYGRLSYYSDNKAKIEYSWKIKEEATKAVELNPNEDGGYHILGRWNYELANLNPVMSTLANSVYGGLPKASNEAAVANFKKAIQLAPNRAIHHIELGRAYAALGEKELAREEIRKGLSLPDRDKDDPITKARGRDALARL